MGTSSHFPDGAQENYPSLLFFIPRPLPRARFLPRAGIADVEVEHGVAVFVPRGYLQTGVRLYLLPGPLPAAEQGSLNDEI